jgi:hypothetical protein
MINNIIYDNIISSINNDLQFINKTNIIYLLVLLVFFYYLKKNKYFILTVFNLINKLYNDIKLNINKIEESTSYIIQISNLKNINRIYVSKNNFSSIFKYIKTCLLNLHIKPINITDKFLRTLSYENTYSVIKFTKKIKNIPDKFIILLNHTHIKYDDYSHLALLLMLFPDHKYCIITNNNICNQYKILEKFKNVFYYQYGIKNNNNIYEDITKIINNDKKIIIIIYPEGYSFRNCNMNDYDINIPNIDNFQITEEKCFNYKKGAFIMSIMNNIPLLQTIFYSPMPDYDYNYFNKIYKIKHINHIGINIYNFIKFKKGVNYERYRSKMEKLFHQRYINTLLLAYKYNPMSNVKIY